MTKIREKLNKTNDKKQMPEMILGRMQRRAGNTFNKTDAMRIHMLDRVSHIASREPSDTLPDRNYLASAPKDVTSTTTYSQGFRFSSQSIRRRLESSWVGPTNAALKHLKLATVAVGCVQKLGNKYGDSVYIEWPHNLVIW